MFFGYVQVLLLQHAVEALWLNIKDLLEETNTAEVRQLTLEFITALVSGQVCVVHVLVCGCVTREESYNDILYSWFF